MNQNGEDSIKMCTNASCFNGRFQAALVSQFMDFFFHLFWKMNTGFYGPGALPVTNQQCQSTEGKSEH